MNQRNTRTGICPGCQNTITVPSKLSAFSCLYCGKRLTPETLLAPTLEILPQEQYRALWTSLVQGLPRAVCLETNTLKYMTKTAYPRRFNDYLTQYRELLAQIPQLFPQSDPEAMDRLSREVVQSIDLLTTQNRRGLSSKSNALEEAKFTLCLLTIPAIRALEQTPCEDFCQSLRRAWLERYPKKPFQLTTREAILSGFQPRKLCYITTAVCRQAGKPDNCRELNAFRCFRDDYLLRQPGGEGLIARYYDCAPGMVLTIDLCRNPEEDYPALWKNWLKPCYDALCAGNFPLCQQLYIQMVEQLPKKLASGGKISETF